MTCNSPHEAVELLGSAAAGALDVEEQSQLDRHLAGCAACREELPVLRRVATRLSALRQVPAAPTRSAGRPRNAP
jgi:anti-sigma factor RsiW